MKTFSHSRLESFDNCPKAFRFHYIDGIRSDTDGIEAFMGSRVHDALEWLYEQVRLNNVPDKEQVMKRYQDSWDRNRHDNIRIVREDATEQNYRDTGRKCLEDYYDRYTPFDQMKVVDTEMRVSLDLGEYSITGFIDRLDMKDCVFEIHDYKTSRSLPTQEKLDNDRQLALYELAVRNKWPDAESVELVWHFLQFDREMRSRRTPEQLRALADETIERIEVINAEQEFPTNPSALCKWCDYQDICPETSHEQKVKNLPPNEYLQDDGVALVNRYIELYDRRQEADRELGKVTEAVVEFARKEGVNVILGSDNKLSVKFEDRPRVPTRSKDPEAYDRMREILREHGVLDQASPVSYSSLKSLLDADPGLVSSLGDLVSWEKGSRVTRSKLKR